MMQQLSKNELEQKPWQALLGLALYQPTPEKCTHWISQLSANAQFWGYTAPKPTGVLVTSEGENGVEILAIASTQKGVGRCLIQHLVQLFPGQHLFAETDRDALGFYHALGFQIHSLGETYPGVQRFQCVYSEHFDALNYAEAINAFQKSGVPAYVAGGWALDLHLGQQSRAHKDTDILIQEADTARLGQVFPHYDIYAATQQGLAQWPRHSGAQYWLRANSKDNWSLEVMTIQVQNGQWIYKRNPQIHGPLETLYCVNPQGIPYVAPEIQLLYKLGSSKVRTKDITDFHRVWPTLEIKAQVWLKQSLGARFPTLFD